MRETVLLPCLWLLSTTGGSRHSVGGHINNRHSAWGRGNLICFPVFGVYLFVRGGPKSIAKLDGGMARCSPPLDPPLLAASHREGAEEAMCRFSYWALLWRPVLRKRGRLGRMDFIGIITFQNNVTLHLSQ